MYRFLHEGNVRPFWEPEGMSIVKRLQAVAASMIENVEAHDGGTTTWHALTPAEKKHVMYMHIIINDDYFGLRSFLEKPRVKPR